MNDNHQDYSTKVPDVPVKVHTIACSLRKHLYLFKTLRGVFSYKKLDLGTEVLIKNMIITENASNILDLGCGYGVIGIVLGYMAPSTNIYFIDINKRAIWCTKENIKLNIPESDSRAHVFAGSYFSPLKGKNLKFDAIYMNPPIRKGRSEFLNLFKSMHKYLNQKALFQFVIRRKLGASFIYNYLIDLYSDDRVKILCKRSGYWVFCFSYDKIEL